MASVDVLRWSLVATRYGMSSLRLDLPSPGFGMAGSVSPYQAKRRRRFTGLRTEAIFRLVDGKRRCALRLA